MTEHKLVEQAFKALGTHTITEDGEDKDVSFLRQTPQGAWTLDRNALHEKDKLAEAADIVGKLAEGSLKGKIPMPESKGTIVTKPGPLVEALLHAKKASEQGDHTPKIIVLDELPRRDDNGDALIGFLDIVNAAGVGNKTWTTPEYTGGKEYSFTHEDLKRWGVIVVATGNRVDSRFNAQPPQSDAESSRLPTIHLPPYQQSDFEDAFLRRVALPFGAIDVVNQAINTYYEELPEQARAHEFEPLPTSQQPQEFVRYLTQLSADTHFMAEQTGHPEEAFNAQRAKYCARYNDVQDAASRIGEFMMIMRNMEHANGPQKTRVTRGGVELDVGLEGRTLNAIGGTDRTQWDGRVLSDQILGEALNPNAPIAKDSTALAALEKQRKKDGVDYESTFGTRMAMALFNRVKSIYADSSNKKEFAFAVEQMDVLGLLPKFIAQNTQFRKKNGLRDSVIVDADVGAGGAQYADKKDLEDLLNIQREKGQMQAAEAWQSVIIDYLIAQAERTGQQGKAEQYREMKDDNPDAIISKNAVSDAIESLNTADQGRLCCGAAGRAGRACHQPRRYGAIRGGFRHLRHASHYGN